MKNYDCLNIGKDFEQKQVSNIFQAKNLIILINHRLKHYN